MSFYDDEDAYILAREYNLLDVTGAKYEPWEYAYDNHVIRIAHIASATNCLIKFNPMELVPPE